MTEKPEIEIEERVVSSPAELESWIKKIVAALRKLDWSEPDLFDVHTALVEAAINALEHGNGRDHDKNVLFAARYSPDRLLVMVQDEGAGFDAPLYNETWTCPSPESERGRGLFLIQQLMSSVRFNEAGNGLVMEKTPSRPS